MNNLQREYDKWIFKGLTIQEMLMSFAIVASVLSFCPNATISRICSVIMYGLWGAVAFLHILANNLRVNYVIAWMAFVYIFMYIFVNAMYLHGIYRTNGLGQSGFLIYCIAFYFVGYNMSIDRRKQLTNLIIWSFVVAQAIFTVLVFFLLKDEESEAKNMTGQVLGVGIVFEALLIPRLAKSVPVKILGFVFAGFAIMTLFNLHSRTPFIAIFIIFIFMFFEKKRPIYAYFLLAILVVSAYIFVFHTATGQEMFQEFIVGDQSVDTSDGLTSDAVLSGRPSLYKESMEDFFEHPLVGLGNWAYIDNFIINALRTGGLVTGILLLPFVYGKLFQAIFGYKKLREKFSGDKSISTLFALTRYLCIFFFVISLMEGYPPLGPGSSAFLLWIVLGVKDSFVRQLSNKRYVIESGDVYEQA